MESFFGQLKTECFYGRKFNSIREVVDAVRDHLDYYSHQWIQLKLKGLSPIQYQKQSFNHSLTFWSQINFYRTLDFYKLISSCS